MLRPKPLSKNRLEAIFFWWGKEGKCIMHCDARASCVGLQYGLPLGSSARWTICRLTYPTKTFPCRLARLHPVKKVDCRVWVYIEVNTRDES